MLTYALDGEEGLYMAQEGSYDGIILDILLPKINGLNILKTLREKGISTPVIMLTAKDSIPDKITGLDSGADDYLSKPFEFGELLARLRALIRRKFSEKRPRLKVLDLELNPSQKEVVRAEKSIPLTAKEFTLLEFLVYNKNRVITQTEIIDHIYNDTFDLDSNVFDVFINNLRKKIDKGFPVKLIHTIRGTGYMLRDPDV
ncbi:MAG TPA: winged helix-turn-helix domain-containing protein [Nitrospiria bacterium]